MLYFDSAATLPVKDSVLSFYAEASHLFFANSGSLHEEGRKAAKELEKARRDILQTLSLPLSYKVIFTSGATESNNLLIKGLARRYAGRGKHIITSLGEHPSVLKTCKQLEKEGFSVTYLSLDSSLGAVSPSTLKEALRKDTILVSLMAINNETGAISPLEEYRQILSSYPKAIFHSDFTQSMFKGPLTPPYQTVDALSFSSHKLGGIKGHGVIVMKEKLDPFPILDGGGQEYGYRSGTVDVPGAMSVAFALKECRKEEKEVTNKVTLIRQKIENYLLEHKEDYKVHSFPLTSPYILNFSLIHQKSAVLLEYLSSKGIAVSTVSACSSKKEEASAPLLAMGESLALAKNSIRLSFSSLNSLEEVDTLLMHLEEARKTLVDRNL